VVAAACRRARFAAVAAFEELEAEAADDPAVAASALAGRVCRLGVAAAVEPEVASEVAAPAGACPLVAAADAVAAGLEVAAAVAPVFD